MFRRIFRPSLYRNGRKATSTYYRTGCFKNQQWRTRNFTYSSTQKRHCLARHVSHSRNALRNRDYEIEGKNPLEVAFKRLQHNEVKSEFAYVPKYVGKVHRTCDRGKEAADVFLLN